MNTPIWSTDENGERWLGALDNPHVFLANPPKRRKGGPRKGVIPPQLRPYLFRKAHGARRNPPVATSTAVVRSYRNPSGGQMVQWVREGARKAKRRAMTFRSSFPALPTIGGGAVGFVGTSWISAAIARYAPSVAANPMLFWGVRIASAILPGWLVKKFASGFFGAAMLVGGMIRLVVDGLQAFAPSLLGAQPRLGYYTAGVVARSLPSGSSGALGQYTPPDAYPASNPGTPMINTTPSRLDPRRRF